MNKLTKTLKKGFSASVVLMTVFSMLGLGALVPVGVSAATVDATTIEAGDLVRKDGLSSVYYITEDLTRMYFPNGEVFKTWFNKLGEPDYSGIKVVSSDTDFDAFWPPQEGVGGINFRSGTLLVTSPETNSVYYVWPGNKRQKIANETAAAALFGANWAGLVRDLPGVFMSNLSLVSGEINGSALLDGMAVTAAGGDGTVWYFDGEMLHQVDGKLHYVHTVSQALIDLYEVSGDTKTAASITSNPSQGVGFGGSGNDDGDDDGDDGDDDGDEAGTVTISLAGDTPSGTFAVVNAIRVPFTKIGFTASGGDVTIDKFVIEQNGVPAQDSDFSKINVINEAGNLLSDAGKTLNSDSQATFTEDLVIPSGQTKYWTLVGDMATSVGGGNLPVLSLISVETNSTVVGSLPLKGNAVQINGNLTLGTVTLSEGAVIGTTVTEQVGAENINLANVKVAVTTNDFQLSRLVLYNSGTAGDTDFTADLRYNNEVIATGVVGSKYVTFDLSACAGECKIDKGSNKTFEVYGNLISGSTRTINLDVRRTSDVLVKDLQHNYFRSPTNNASAMSNTITVSEGRLTVSKTNDVPAGNIPEDSDGLELGSWNFKVQGEPITINTMVLRLVGTGSTQSADVTSIVLYDAAGNALTGGVDGNGAASTGYATSSDSFTLPVGDNVITAKGNLNSDPAIGDTLTLSVDFSQTVQLDATGQDSGEVIDIGTDATPQGYVQANALTIKAATLRVTNLSTPPSRTLAAGTNDVEFAHVLFDAADSSEDIKVTQVKVLDTTGAAAPTIDLQNCRLFVDKDGDSFDGTGTAEALSVSKSGSDSGVGDAETLTFNLSGADQFIVKKGKKSKVVVKCDLAGSAATGSTATHNLKVADSASTVASIGVNTGTTVSSTIDSASGQTITVGAAGGQVEIGLDAASPNAALYAAGTSGVTLAVFNALATTTEDVELEHLKLTMNITDTASSSFQDYALLYVENESGETVGSVVPTSTTPVIQFGSKKVVLNVSDTDGSKLYLKANLATIGPNESITVGGHNLGFQVAANGDIKGKGAQTGTDSTEYRASTAPTGATHYAYRGVPTVQILTSEVTNSLTSNSDIFKFKVSANSGDIGLYKFTFDIATSGVTLTELNLYDVTGGTEILLYTKSTISLSGNESVVAVLLDDDNPSSGDGGEERQVSTGLARTYLLKGTFTGTGDNGDTVTTRLAGDAANYVNGDTLMDTASQIDADVNDDFIWSDRNLSGHSTSTEDWANGYLVSGLGSASSTAISVD